MVRQAAFAQTYVHDRIAQLYQREILFRAHDARVTKALLRHTWPGVRRGVGRYVSQCFTWQQVRDKPRDVRFHLNKYPNWAIQ